MSRIIIFLIGITTGWFLKEGNWQKWLQKLQAYFKPQQTSQPPIPLLEKKEINIAPAKADEIFADPLEKIKGIGPVIKGRLNEKGIYTFAQLAALSPTELEEILGAGIKRLTDEDAIIRQAKEYAL